MEKRITFPSVLPNTWFDEKYIPLPHKEEFEAVMQQWEKAFATPQGRLLKADYRGKIFNFVETQGYVAEGATQVDIAGTYVVGTPPKYNSDTKVRAVRTLGEQLYAMSGVEAFNKVAKDTGWVHRDDEDYSSRRDALLAVEADSCSSKGPYDNGTDDTALKTVSAVLSNTLKSKPVPDEDWSRFDSALARRYEEYKGYTNRKYASNSSLYVEHMRKRGLSNTMRGFPFMAGGDVKMQPKWVFATEIIFSNVPDFPIRFNKAQEYLNLTVDEFIQLVNETLDKMGLKVADWYSLHHSIIIPISRNQGSPFKVKWDNGRLKLTGERKDMKYRLVTPISAFVQSRSILAVDDLVRNAKRTVGRIGLMDPQTNTEGMNTFLRNAHSRNKVIISTDFTGYDSTLHGQYQAGHCNMYAYLYDDPWVKDGMVCAALSLTQKSMWLPCYNSDQGQPYPQFDRYFMKTIKGIRSFSNAKVIKTSIYKNKAAEDLRVNERFDYSVWAFYIYDRYLASGHILTNATGSDSTLALSRFMVSPEMGDEDCEANASGDDCIQEVSLSLFMALGLEKIYLALEKAYAKYGMIVNASKQLKILFRGLPLVDFLQQVYLQGEVSAEFQHAYHKFMRQFFSLIYTERRSNLGPILQWVIVLGKGESGVCEENIEFAASVLDAYGTIIEQAAKEKGYQPIVHQGLRRAKENLHWDKSYTIANSSYGGFEQLLGLVKQYGQDLVSALGKYAAGQLDKVVKDFDKELETRAPHREGFAKAFYKALGDTAYEEAGGDGRFGETVIKTEFNFIKVLDQWMKVSKGVAVTPVVLDQPLIGAGFLHDGSDVPDSDDAEDYEFDNSHVD